MANTEASHSALIPAFTLIGLASFASGAVGSTHIYLIEQFVCHERFELFDRQSVKGGGLVDESLCKLPGIQSKVAQINGLYIFLCFIPSLILTGPWGKLARVFGKKKVLFLNVISIFLGAAWFIFVCYYRHTFDIRFIWLKPLFNILGGGQVILSSLIMTFVAESVDSKNLSAVLYRFSAICLGCTFLGTSLSAFLLRVNVWLLCAIGLSAYALMIPISLSFPNSTTPRIALSSYDHACKSSTHSTFEFASEATSLLSCPSCNISQPSALRTVLEALKSNHRHNIDLFNSIIFTSPLSRSTIFAFFLLQLTEGIAIIFTQWASVTYHWIIADIQALDSFQMVVSGVVLLCLPMLTSKLLSPHLMSSSRVDMVVSKTALLFLIMGLGLMSISPTRACYVLAYTVRTFSIPLTDSLRSFSTGLIGDKEEVEKLYLGISMVETIGGMLSTALWSGIFSVALGKGWIIERMPFWGCLLVLGFMWLVLRRLTTLSSIIKTEVDDEAGSRECA